jgi:hypothetical protein
MFPRKYWIYYLDTEDNFLDASQLDGSSDMDALLKAAARAGDYVIELWDHDRLVARLEPKAQIALASKIMNVIDLNKLDLDVDNLAQSA